MQISDHMLKYVWNVTYVISYFKPPLNQILEMQEMWVQSLGWEHSLEEEMANAFQYSCLGNSMDRGAWQATVHGVAKSWTWLSDWTHSNAKLEGLWGQFALYNDGNMFYLASAAKPRSNSLWDQLWTNLFTMLWFEKVLSFLFSFFVEILYSERTVFQGL